MNVFGFETLIESYTPDRSPLIAFNDITFLHYSFRGLAGHPCARRQDEKCPVLIIFYFISLSVASGKDGHPFI